MAEIHTLSDATLSIERGVRYMNGAQVILTGDRMIVEDRRTGHQDDVIIFTTDGALRAQRLAMHMALQAGASTHVFTTAGYSLADLGAENEKRLLAIYRMFPTK